MTTLPDRFQFVVDTLALDPIGLYIALFCMFGIVSAVVLICWALLNAVGRACGQSYRDGYDDGFIDGVEEGVGDDTTHVLNENSRLHAQLGELAGGAA